MSGMARFPGGTVSFETPQVQEALGDLPDAGSSGDELHDLTERRSERIPADGGSRASEA